MSRRGKKPQTSDTTSIMNLSLFMMLMSFFVVLNAVSSFDEGRAKPIIDSLNRTFGEFEDGEMAAPSTKQGEEEVLGEGDVPEILEEFFRAHIGDAEIRKNITEGTLTVRMPVLVFEDEFLRLGAVEYDDNNFVSQNSTNYVVPLFASIIRADLMDEPYSMTLSYEVNGNPVQIFREAPDGIAAVTKKFDEYGNVLMRAGVTPGLMAMGMMQGEGGMVQLDFKPLPAHTRNTKTPPQPQVPQAQPPQASEPQAEAAQ